MSVAADFDAAVRARVYDVAMQRGTPPSILETGAALEATHDQVKAAFQRLANGRVLVLQPDSGEILMAAPFSSVPTPFLVETERYSCYANCIWDALGIPAMLHGDARIRTACGCCGFAMKLTVRHGDLAGEGEIHFAVAAKEWWTDIVFT